MSYKDDLTEANEYHPNCDQCDKPCVVLLDGWPLCGRHWAQYRGNRAYRPAISQAPVRLTGQDVAAALNPPEDTTGCVSARTAIAALERSVGK